MVVATGRRYLVYRRVLLVLITAECCRQIVVVAIAATVTGAVYGVETIGRRGRFVVVTRRVNVFAVPVVAIRRGHNDVRLRVQPTAFRVATVHAGVRVVADVVVLLFVRRR